MNCIGAKSSDAEFYNFNLIFASTFPKEILQQMKFAV